MLTYGYRVNLWLHSISVSKSISEPPQSRLQRIHLQWVMAGVRRSRGNRGGQSDGKYIFSRPWST
jgi:hypothetical protein